MKCPKCTKEMLEGELRVRGTCVYCWEIEWYKNTDDPSKPFRPAALKIKDMETKAYRCPYCDILLLGYGKDKEKTAGELNQTEEVIRSDPDE